ncbi:MAG: hypothetical protein GC204_10185 [Chloroflexi bacterium]|nr:hypothetical protein [Chloroflexota bacterium]
MADQTAVPQKQFRLIGENLSLNFANTVGDHATDHPDEYLEGYPDLVLWGQQAGILAQAVAEKFSQQARKSPREAEQVLDLALALREAIYHIFSATAAGNSPRDADIELLNGVLEAKPVQLHVARVGEKFVCEWLSDNDVLDSLLAPIAWSAATLLASDELQQVKECANEGCGWLFLDTSKNHSRRWCDMADCGSRVKAKRYYRRQHPE